MEDENSAVPSTDEAAGNSLDTMTGEQRSEWLLNGTPMPKDEADPAPAPKHKSEAAKPEPTPAADTGNSEEPKLGSRAHQRIQELLTERASLRARLDQIEAAGKNTPADKPADSAPAKPAAETKAVPSDGRPVPPDPEKWTGTWEELEKAKLKYFDEYTDWKMKQPERDRQAADTAKAQAKLTELQQGYKTRAEAVLAADPEYADAQDIIGKFVTAKGVDQLILESEVGPEIVMHLYKLPYEEQQRVAGLTPAALAREITRLEDKLSQPAAAAAAAPQPKHTSAAKKPPTELSGRNATNTVDEAEQALEAGDMGKYIAVMNARAVKKPN